MYSYGWRDYMPDIGRWNGIDQLAEKYLSTGTYTYVANNPVSNADVDGRWFNNDGSIDTSGTANGFVRTRSYAQSYLGQNSQQGGGSAEVIAKMVALGGDWYNTGYGFAGTAKIGLAYDGSYTSLNTDLDSYINIPEITLSGSSFFWGLQAQNQFNSYMGSWNSKSDFAYSRASCGHCNDGHIKMIGGAGDPAGIYDIAGQVISNWEPQNRYLAMGVGLVGGIALKKPGLVAKEESNIWKIGAYNEMRGLEAGLDAHHVGQSAIMKKLVAGYDHKTAPTILVPKLGHTF